MNQYSNWIRTLGFALIIAAISGAAVSFGFVRANLDDIRTQWHHNLLWSSSQLEIEYLRFQETLVRFGRPEFDVDHDDVLQRFDILWSRINLFQQGSIGVRGTEYPEANYALMDLRTTMETQEDAIANLQDGDLTATKGVLEAFSKHDKAVRLFNRAAMGSEVRFGTGLRDSLIRSQIMLTWLGAGAILASLSLLAYFAAETGRQKRAAAENLSLFNKARSASRAKTAFLNMMSHELRTPMNGILGMIALARRQGVAPQQEGLLEQASESSKQLNNLLSDILDFSALEDKHSDEQIMPFLVQELQSKVKTALQPLARSQEIDFTVIVDGCCPASLVGDPKRLRQSIVHLASYLGKISSPNAVHVRLRFEDGVFQCILSFNSGPETCADWPAIVLGQEVQAGEEFSADALGPIVARGFVENMGGSLRLTGAENRIGVASVVVEVPVEIHAPADVVVRIETQTSALQTICQNAIAAPHVRFYSEGYDGPVHTIIVETGSQFERDTCLTLRQQYPDARFVALGVPQDRSLFEDEIKLPIDVATLRSAPFLNITNS